MDSSDTSTIITEAVVNFETITTPSNNEVIPIPINSETLSNAPKTLLIAENHLQVPSSSYTRTISNVTISDTTHQHHKDEKPKVFFNETYVIFLPECFFIYSWYTYRYYGKIIKNLRSKGIKVINISKIVKYQESNHDSSLLFDDKKYPDPNILYIHLFNGL